jgi:hypothetical protein
MRSVFVFVLLIAAVVALSAGVQARTAAGPVTWSGTFTLPRGTQSSPITLVRSGGSGVVSLVPGRVAREPVQIRGANGAVRFRLAGRPSDLVFAGRLRGNTIRGGVRQGAAHGSFVLVRGRGGGESFLGTYTVGGERAVEVIDLGRLGLPLWLVDLDTGPTEAAGCEADLAVGRLPPLKGADPVTRAGASTKNGCPP